MAVLCNLGSGGMCLKKKGDFPDDVDDDGGDHDNGQWPDTVMGIVGAFVCVCVQLRVDEKPGGKYD